MDDLSAKQGYLADAREVCPLCQNTRTVLVRTARLMGATYPEDDSYKGDEHFAPCPICCAQAEGKPKEGWHKVSVKPKEIPKVSPQKTEPKPSLPKDWRGRIINQAEDKRNFLRRRNCER